ncbi:FAD-dependent monooxygenase [Pigmentiphaga sp. GD03639]|jgi:3-(3-hydroxy-phenyl)propionate hydroxylase|uniref:NAD(P)/FAD-dependent oxidoreductase n=1 Tax=Pigmentiphaga daeguensis TaxID=414049 RepID=A0ABP3L909_9BURK|nr:FAD-dependent monooxygenase [Pigmentiphaga sp. GD03639]MDH2238883.1 FAD-dependent monooxygenase [Pigmentiphaga sp. GD03639]
MPKARVLVAGAGPVGLVSAMVLADAGIEVELFERNASVMEDLRASTFHPPTLDMLDRYGIADPLVEAGLKARYTQQRDRRKGLIAEFDLARLAGSTKYPFRLQCEQWKLNDELVKKLASYPNARVRFGCAVESVQQDEGGVTVQLRTADGIETARGDFLIGADGAWSAVRNSVGIEFEGYTYPERFLVVSTQFPFEQHFENLSLVNYISDPEEWCVLLKVPSLWRVLFPTPEHESDERVLSDAVIERRLQGLLPQPRPYQIVHRTLYKVHQRVAAQFRKGRVLLAGDSAHINNPLGGMGMNGGVHDAFNLTGKLIEVLAGRAPIELLDLYERQRRTVAIEYINANTARNKKMIEERDEAVRSRIHDELRATATDPVASLDYIRKTSMFDALERAAEIA